MGERRNEEKLADTGTPFDPSTKLRVVSLSNHMLRAGGDTVTRRHGGKTKRSRLGDGANNKKI